MKRLSILTVTLLLSPNCAIRTGSQMNGDLVSRSVQQASVTPTPATDRGPDDSEPPVKKKDVPVPFREIDFNNFSYRISWKHRIVALKNGRAEYFQDKYLGNAWFELRNVEFADLTGDGRADAIVDLLWVSCGGSCDGGSYLFYFYSFERGKVNLLSRIESGSLAYGECGLKTFMLVRNKLTLETFHVCRFDGTSINVANDPHPNPEARTGKFTADKFTRFRLEFRRSRFVLNKREILLNPQNDIMNYSAKIEISHD